MKLDIDRLSAWHTSRGHREQVLDAVSLDVPAGELLAVLGPSGSGKTTLLRVIAGLHRDAEGAIALGGRSLGGVAPERRGVGLVPQDGALFPHLTVTENIDFGLPRAERRGRRVAEMLDLLGLTPFASRMPHQLSGGQAQRVAVARALAPAPALILLDEPFSALDAALRGEVRGAVRAALAETGTTALLVTHDQGEALSTASQLTVLADGRVRQSGTPEQVYAEPADLWTGKFLGEANVFASASDGTMATTPLGRVAHAPVPAGAVDVLIRPEQLRIDAAGEARASVRAIRFFGHDALIELALDTGGQVLVRIGEGPVPHAGERVGVRVSGVVRAYSRGR